MNTLENKVDFLVDKAIKLNIFEMRYFSASMKERIQKTTGMNPLKLNMDWPSIKQEADGTWPPLNPNWFKQQELMAKVGPFMESMGMTSSASQQTQGDTEGQEPAQEESKDEKKTGGEQTNFDIELLGFDAKTKIKLIKEVRSMFSLGLKEAKDTVENTPCWLQKDVQKAEAEDIVKKLEELGAKLRLV